MGTSSKILHPDGSLNSAGCLFDSVSSLPYDAMHGFPSDFPASERISLLPGVNSCCSAFRTADVISKNGLSCIYKSRLAIQDLCLQLSPMGIPVLPLFLDHLQSAIQMSAVCLGDIRSRLFCRKMARKKGVRGAGFLRQKKSLRIYKMPAKIKRCVLHRVLG